MHGGCKVTNQSSPVVDVYVLYSFILVFIADCVGTLTDIQN
jgi:hypothetical protein